jgi:hypothetical protein
MFLLTMNLAGITNELEPVPAESISDVLRRSWFLRMWTLQELALSSNAFVHCGGKSMSWDSFYRSWLVIYGLENFSIGSTFTGLATYFQVWAIFQRGDRFGARKLHKILRWTRGQQATNPKDKIYALYGIFRRLRVGFPEIDYSKSVERIYTEATMRMIIIDDSLEIIRQVCSEHELPSLPSWVPDWSDTQARIFPMGNFHASQNSTPRYSFSEDMQELSLVGKRIARIIFCGQSRPQIPIFRPANIDLHEWANSIIFSIRAIRDWVQFTVQHLIHTQLHPSIKIVLEALRRVLTLDDHGLPDQADPQEQQLFHDWLQIVMIGHPMSISTVPGERLYYTVNNRFPDFSPTLKPYYDSPAHKDIVNTPEWNIYLFLYVLSTSIRDFQKRVDANCRTDYLLFVTESGRLGMAQESINAGDLVVLISGVPFPVIARVWGDKYRMIGPAFVNGIMHGEEWPSVENEGAELTEFVFL